MLWFFLDIQSRNSPCGGPADIHVNGHMDVHWDRLGNWHGDRDGDVRGEMCMCILGRTTSPLPIFMPILEAPSNA